MPDHLVTEVTDIGAVPKFDPQKGNQVYFEWHELRKESLTEMLRESWVSGEQRDPPNCLLEVSTADFRVTSTRITECRYQVWDQHKAGSAIAMVGTGTFLIGIAGIAAGLLIIAPPIGAACIIGGTALAIAGGGAVGEGVRRRSGPRWTKRGQPDCGQPSDWIVSEKMQVSHPHTRREPIDCEAEVTSYPRWIPHPPRGMR